MDDSRAVIRPRFAPGSSTIADFLSGLTAPLLAARYLLARPNLWKYTLAGAIVTVALFAGFATLAVTQADTLANALWTRPETSTGTAMWWVLAIISGAALLGVAGVVTLVASQIVMAPLYSRLGERVEGAILEEGEFEETFFGSARDELRGVGHSLLTVAVFAAVMVPIVLLNVVPFFGSVVAACFGAVVSAFVLAFEFGDNSLSRRKARWLEKLRQAVGELAVTMGLGAGIALMMLIPVVGFFLVPVAVVAGTMVFCGLLESGRIRVPDRRIPKGSTEAAPTE